MGGQQYRAITNSDIIQLEHFHHKLLNEVYTQQVQDDFNKEKNKKALQLRHVPNQCHECNQIVSETPSFWSNFAFWGDSPSEDTTTDCLKYCHYSMDTITCKDCMAEEPMFIPRELQLDCKP